VEDGKRRLIRPPMTNSREPLNAKRVKKAAPPDQTNAENFYYVKQMQSKTPMVIVMKDGELLHGVIEWYDKCCLKFNREEGPNLLVFKPAIKYMYKA
jgi:host factor-I protein